MKLRLLAFLGVGLIACQVHAEKKEKAVTLKDQKDKISYILGLNLGADLKSKSMDVNPDLLAVGIKDFQAGGKPLLTDAEIKETIMAYEKEMNAKMRVQQGAPPAAAADPALAEKSKKEGEAFLSENKKKKGVKTLPSGLQYKVIKDGTGAIPKATDTVVANYRGTLINGTEFDSSERHGGPATFAVSRLIPGWTAALQLMKTGSKWQLVVPSNLAYGEMGQGPIPPHAALLFEMELVSIK